MVVHREIIQALRAKRSGQAIDELLAEGESQLMTLLTQSGLLEKGLDPRSLKLSPEQQEAIIKAAEALEAQGRIDQTNGRTAGRGRTPV